MMKEIYLNRLLGLFILLILLMTMTACGEKRQSPDTNVGEDNSGIYSIHIENYSFNPKELTVPVGTEVTWTNLDSVSHTVEGEGFTSNSLGKGDSYTFTFTAKGIYEYNCRPHPSMKGIVTVE